MTSGRWWEFYFVRYAMGTVIGALVVITLMHIDPALNRVLGRLLDGLDGGGRFAVLGGLGLVYCYISSIPILVLHAGRLLLPIGPRMVKRSKLRKLYEEALPAVFTATVYAFSVLYVFVQFELLRSPELDNRIANLSFLAFIVTVMVLAGLTFSLTFFRSRCYQFYKNLAKARARQGDAGELITSYRHLREHGNSIFIVALEAVFGLTMLSAYRVASGLKHEHLGLIYAPQFYLYGVIAMAWILPGVAVWLFATLIENEFVRDPMWP
ncbi:hypothetical protein [Dyella sp. C11]|uniref:hypothetical protein n=1 Tax=Dyella sp. C11 TaxID=2126991 RepID=UPI000D651497|nr:hypothetical protein [Dyella sp. C11]